MSPYSHVDQGTRKSAYTGLHQLARDAEITEFDHPVTREYNIRRFDVTVDCLFGM